MNILNAIIFGIVEGITEFLPISSTGHLILTAQILRISHSDFVKSFEIAIQLGAIFSVVILYSHSLLLDLKIMKKLAAAFFPTMIIGLIFYKLVKRLLLGNSHVVIWSLLIGGILIILFELLHREKADPSPSAARAADSVASISYAQAIFIGLVQSIAIIPGVSRSAATIIGGLLLGLKRKTIVEFSFLLAVPTMLAATAFDLYKNANTFTHDQFIFLSAGFVTSFIVALIAIKFLLAFIRHNTFIAFGIYRIVIALLFFFLVDR